MNNEILTKYNLLISVILAALIAAADYLSTNSTGFTWPGLLSAVVVAVVNFYTTRQGKEQGKVEGAQAAQPTAKAPTDF